MDSQNKTLSSKNLEEENKFYVKIEPNIQNSLM